MKTSLETVLSILRAPAILNSGAALETRMISLCRQTAELLGCDRSSIFLWDGQTYRGTFNWGNPPEIARFFPQFAAGPETDIVQLVEAAPSHVVINDARNHPATVRIAEVANIQSIVLARFEEPDGSRLGMMTAEFNERMGTFDSTNALITKAAAHIAHAAVVQERETARRLELSRAVLQVQDRERRRLGRDIHDDALQRSFALGLKIETLLTKVDEPSLRSELQAILADARTTTTVLRQVITRVHPDSLHALGLESLIRDLLKILVEQRGWQAAFDDTRTEPNSDEVERSLGRIVQQALQNAAQHARATTVSVSLRNERRGTALTIVDDGVGFDPAAVTADRLGLVSMRERATLLAGTFRIESRLNAGCTVNVWIPRDVATRGSS